MQQKINGIRDFFWPKPTSSLPSERFQIPEADFDYKNRKDLKCISDHVLQFNSALTAMRALLRTMLIGITLAIVCWTATFFTSTLTVTGAMIGAAIFTHSLGQYSRYYKAFTEALADLKQVHQWSMGKETNNLYEKLAIDSLQRLILTLGPWVKGSSIATWVDDDLKVKGFISIFGSKRTDLSPGFVDQLNYLASGAQEKTLEYQLLGESGPQNLLNYIKAKILELYKKFTSSEPNAFITTIKLD